MPVSAQYSRYFTTGARLHYYLARLLWLSIDGHWSARLNTGWPAPPPPPLPFISIIVSRFTKNKSLVAGALSWGLSALILLIPVFVSGSSDPEFGYNQQSGKLLEKCELKNRHHLFSSRNLYNTEEARPIHNIQFLYCCSLSDHLNLLHHNPLSCQEI